MWAYVERFLGQLELRLLRGVITSGNLLTSVLSEKCWGTSTTPLSIPPIANQLVDRDVSEYSVDFWGIIGSYWLL